MVFAGALGPQETSGDLRGRLATGNAGVAEATVTATSRDLLGNRRTVTAADGVFVLLAHTDKRLGSLGTFDVQHVGNPRTAVRVDEPHYTSLDAQGNQATPNPTWLQPTAFQPPMAARLGIELSF